MESCLTLLMPSEQRLQASQVLLERLEREALLRADRDKCEKSLIEFVRAGWTSVDNSPFMENWAIDGLCEHLQAVSDGHIKRLLVNFPPRCSKTLVTSVCWPAWTWAQPQGTFLKGPNVKFLCGSYNHELALQNSNLTRRLILSPWYQARWGSRFGFQPDQNTKHRFDTTKGGSRIANSVTGSLLGIGGDIILIDDPHNTNEVESEAERETVGNWWKEIRSTRLNNPKLSPIVVIMQRLHEEDVTGLILNGPDADEWVHFMVPMEHEVDRHCSTYYSGHTWEDPRTEENELMWPERFGPEEVRGLKRDLGPYMASGRLQQSPQPKGGGILKGPWWKLWGDSREEVAARAARGEDVKPLLFPPMGFVIASLDTAYTEKEENDYSALTIWGSWEEAVKLDSSMVGKTTRLPRLMLMNAWKDRLEVHQLVERVNSTCARFKVDRLIIESAAVGISVAQELQRLYGNAGYATHLLPAKGDKVARAYSVQHMLAEGMIYAPDREWADMVITECANFPKGAHDDLVDSTTQALRHLRDIGLAVKQDEAALSLAESLKLKRKVTPLYPGMRSNA